VAWCVPGVSPERFGVARIVIAAPLLNVPDDGVTVTQLGLDIDHEHEPVPELETWNNPELSVGPSDTSDGEISATPWPGFSTTTETEKTTSPKLTWNCPVCVPTGRSERSTVTVTIVSPGDSVPVVGVADNHGVATLICHETVAVVPFWSMIGRLPVCAEKLSEVTETEICPCGGLGSPGPDGDELFEHDRTTQTATPSTKLGRGLATNLGSLNAPPVIVEVNSRTLYASLGLTPLRPAGSPGQR
jgi:hypothetical protein